jgi:hydrogenase expression/formation protein HypD
MKFVAEYRNPEQVEALVNEIKKTITKDWRIMEVCGGQTHGLVKNGILEMLPDSLQMVHGPGCPVCVTPLHLIDKAIYLALEKDVILCSFGDMLRVPGSEKSLLQAKAEGADIRILYSPLDAVKIAQENPDREIVFFAVGFETTSPANALSVVQAKKLGLDNYSILVSHVLVPPAIDAVMNDPETKVNGFLAAGHVMTIMGYQQYQLLVEKYKIPIVITGFEPVDLLQGILLTVKQLESGNFKLQNQYSRIAHASGNEAAKELIRDVFKVDKQIWRGIGEIPESGLHLNDEFMAFDANLKFDIQLAIVEESQDCIAGQVLKGIEKPSSCPMFGNKCTPENPLGAPMVSSEGACAAYYHYSNLNDF